MTLGKLFEKYGHVEVFSVEDSMLKSYHDKGWEGLHMKKLKRLYGTWGNLSQGIGLSLIWAIDR